MAPPLSQSVLAPRASFLLDTKSPHNSTEHYETKMANDQLEVAEVKAETADDDGHVGELIASFQRFVRIVSIAVPVLISSVFSPPQPSQI